jgi:hypothetical protein
VAIEVGERYWLEIPTVADGSDFGGRRPKYSVAARAVLVYRGEKVCVLFGDETARAEVERHSDVRRLLGKEAQELEGKYPFLPLLTTDAPDPSRGRAEGAGGVVLLGDIITRLAKILGIIECEPCRKRRKLLNRIPLWGWWRPDRA